MSSSLRFLRPKNDGGGGDDGCFDGVELEVTVLSADSLRLPPSYSPLPRRLRPYVTVASSDAPAGSACSTAVAVGSGGGGEHAWGDTLVVPVGAGFLEGRAHVHVSVLSEPACRLVGATPLGWCRIPVADVLDGLRPPRALRRLSYSLRCPRRCGGGGAPGRGHGVVHLAVRVLGLRDDAPARTAATAPLAAATAPVQRGWCRVAMGIPVSGAASAVVGVPLSSWGASATSR